MAYRAAGKLSEAASILRISNCFSSSRERTQSCDRFPLDTSLSSSVISNNSTRHSVTSRIQRNSRFLSNLIFSSRHLNATLEKRKTVEKFNTCPSLLIRHDSLKLIATATYNPRKLPAAAVVPPRDARPAHATHYHRAKSVARACRRARRVRRSRHNATG